MARTTSVLQRYGSALLLALLPWAVPARTLERGNGPEPSTLDAHRCQEVACGNVLRDLYEGLVTEDAHGRLIPGMAQRWTLSPDGRTWTFHLRDGLRWSNGEALDAPQIVASFRRAFAPATAAPFGELFDALLNAQAVQAGKLPLTALGVSAPDARTVVFRLQRSASLPALLTLPIAFPVYLPAVQRYGAQHTRPGRLVSNGAYRLAAWTPQANLLVEKNPRFHDASGVAIAQVRFHVTEDAAAELQRYAAGDLDLTEVVPPQPLTALRARFGTQLRLSPYLGAFWLGMNLEREPLRDTPQLRRALALAIDRDLLARHVTGLGETPAYGIVPPGIEGYTPAATPWSKATQAQREAQARALYRAAGYSSERPLVIELRYNTSTPHRRLALAVAAMWRQTLGVQVRLRNEEWKVFVQNRRQRAITQVFRGGWIGDVPDARNFLAAFGSDGPLNWTGYDDAGFRQRLARADAAATEAARNAWLHAAETRLLNADAVIPLYYYTSKHLVSDELRGYEANALDRHASRWLSFGEGAR
ncbi:peptide ABC transporter substrate-binding protein [Lysobacter silvisoli]|uniref:Peptide ABC transporter substrate-binding protein n=1 Tax=Lysobacter silvisoli TaxID=2293254 RepID=A0A371JWI2_9GAMM|nr:peptide ABC transporter substrate-binding protein [Lysobacter silvisoli]RDZ26036.1 peptide ABC transporter substrate-binding protein [Lysobacter silvisoli]